jgi:hypothetical protein
MLDSNDLVIPFFPVVYYIFFFFFYTRWFGPENTNIPAPLFFNDLKMNLLSVLGELPPPALLDFAAFPII